MLPPLPSAIIPKWTERSLGPVRSMNRHDSNVFDSLAVQRLTPGCYTLRLTPFSNEVDFGANCYDGTLRIERSGVAFTVSGDLYLSTQPASNISPQPSGDIPIFARENYRYYVRIGEVLTNSSSQDSIVLNVSLHRFQSSSNSWSFEGDYTWNASFSIAPSGFPSPSGYFVGELINSSGTKVGLMSAGWVATYLRRAIIEIDRVNGCETPRNSGTGITWRTVFDPVGWDVSYVESDSIVAEPSDNSWSDAEMHQTMLEKRDSSDLDREWRYHVLCVRTIESTTRGIMYDAFATDSNNVPREGVGISTEWIIPNADPWGKVKGIRFGSATAPYFRTAIHEIGHAMGLYHNSIDNGIMNTTDTIASNATPSVQFPENIKWEFAHDDCKRLRHLPDIWVRPGGMPFGLSYNSAPFNADDLVSRVDGLFLEVSALLEVVPIGAPVRVDIALRNDSHHELVVPKTIGLKGCHVSGKVLDPVGVARTFSPLLLCLDEEPLISLAPGCKITDSLTLLRGGDGSLFPISGVYQVVVELNWETEVGKHRVSGKTELMISPVENKDHAYAAFKTLSSPDLLLTLALGGDYLSLGLKSLEDALGNPVLHPHFAAIEAKRLGRRYGKRKPDVRASLRLISDRNVVVSHAELKRILEIARKNKSQGLVSKNQATVLIERAKDSGLEQSIVEGIGELVAVRRSRKNE
jgi:hypothetical protein